ncbi:unnamed protein product [Mytilus coruscus]|uniref:Uncharacterized protein n=1 Tax=Mytilus coruscus TaxID=42192 RepID=A0A6J8E8W6_MYTCO|nr:unnamed protein product [Mytilus coruscus]
MSSDESDGDFEGFSKTDIINAEQEVLAAEERLRIILNEQGIGDDSDGNLIESGNEDEGEQEVNIDERRDGGDGWHNGFNIFERGIIYPSWQYWAKSRHGCWKGGHRFLALFKTRIILITCLSTSPRYGTYIQDKLRPEDKATLHFIGPYDILKARERSQLIKAFLRVGNKQRLGIP